MRACVQYAFLPVLALSIASPVFSFSTLDQQGGNIHAEITREALGDTISGANLDFVIKAGASQDAPDGEGISERRRHFDDCSFSAAVAYMDREKKMALNYAGEADSDAESRGQALRHFGLMLHTAQDFYSRSNYVELQLEDKARRANPYDIDLVDWTKVPDHYVGPSSGKRLVSGKRSQMAATSSSRARCDATTQETYEELNKDTPSTAAGQKKVGSTTYFKIARYLAVRESQRQWTLFEAQIQNRFGPRAQAILAALKHASPAEGSAPDKPPEVK